MKICSSAIKSTFVSLTAGVACLALSQATFAQVTNAPAAPPPGSGPLATATTPGLPFGASEVVKMYQGGIGKDVIINYVNNSVLPFHLSADNIIYLQQLGLPQDVTKAIILRDGELQTQAVQYQQYQQQMQQQQMAMNSANGAAGAQGAPGVGAQPQVAMPSTPPPQIDYSGDYADAGYPYAYPYYPYDYGGVYIGGWPYWGGGWGWRGGWGGYRGGWGGYRGGYGGFHGGFGGGFHGGGFGGGGFHGGGGFGGGGHGGGGGGHR